MGAMQTTTRAIHGEPAYTRVKREPTRLLSLYNRCVKTRDLGIVPACLRASCTVHPCSAAM